MIQTVVPQRTRQADLLTQYELLRRFGGSDRASVHLARDRVLGQQVAIKLFRDEYSRDPDRIARLYAIARTAAGLSEGAIVRVLDHGTSWHAAFITSEWIAGRDLAALLEAEAPLPPRRAAAIVAQVLDALAPAHVAGIIHGDLHPHNILLRDETDRVTLSDFGIGGLFPAHNGAAYAPYSTPELALTSATDIFAVGAVLRALVTPRSGAAAAGEAAALLAIADRATDRDPAARYPDAPAMRAALEGVVGVLARPQVAPAAAPPAPPPVATATPAGERTHSRRGLLVLLGGLLLGGAAGAGLFVRSATTPTPATPGASIAANLPEATTTPVVAEQPAPTAAIPANQPTIQATSVPAPSGAPQATAAPATIPTTAPAAPPVASAAPSVAPTATTVAPTASAQPVIRYTATFDATWIENAYRRDDGALYGRPTVALYSVGTGYERGIITFQVSDVPTVPLALNLVGLDDERTAKNGFRVTLNGATIFDGVTAFPNVPDTDRGVGGASRYWGPMAIPLPVGALRTGTNKLTLENTTPGGKLGVPYILINAASIIPTE